MKRRFFFNLFDVTGYKLSISTISANDTKFKQSEYTNIMLINKYFQVISTPTKSSPNSDCLIESEPIIKVIFATAGAQFAYRSMLGRRRGQDLQTSLVVSTHESSRSGFTHHIDQGCREQQQNRSRQFNEASIIGW